MAQNAEVRRQELLRRIRTHQASINAYVRKSLRRRDLVANTSIASSAIAAALVAGPAVGGPTFTETVQKGLGFEHGSSVWSLLCWASLIVNLVAAISANLNKSNDPTERINIAEVCNAELEGLRAKVEFGNLAVGTAVGEYGKIVAKALFVPVDLADNVDSKGGENTSPLSRYRSAEVVMPGMAIVFGCIVVAMTAIGLLLGQGEGAAVGPPRLVLSTSQVKISDTYSITASGFSPGEDVEFSWTGPVNATTDVFHATMGVVRADTGGSAKYGGKIVEKTPPGGYAITAVGLTSGRIISALLVVQPGVS